MSGILMWGETHHQYISENMYLGRTYNHVVCHVKKW